MGAMPSTDTRSKRIKISQGTSGAHRDEIRSKLPRTVETPTRRPELEVGCLP